MQVGFAPVGESPMAAYGFQTHDGADTTFGPDADGDQVENPGHPAFVTGRGDVMLATTIPYTGDPGYAFVRTGYLRTADSEFQSKVDQFPFGPSDVVTGDPATVLGTPVYDLVSGTVVEHPPEATTTTSPATVTPTTLTPTVVPGDEVETVDEDCWWCWAMLIVFALLLVLVVLARLKSLVWWTCWIAWLIVIIAWVPLLLVGLWFWQPDWWWWPLLAWFPIVGGYLLVWGPRQAWWRRWMAGAVLGYLAVLAIAAFTVGDPEWWLLLPLFWVPLVAFYAWARGSGRPWWLPWAPWALAAYVAWVFVWAVWLTPAWIWWFGVVLVAVILWWFVVVGHAWAELWGPKWGWIIPFALVPLLAFGIPLWCEWWCWVVVAAIVLVVAAAARHGFWQSGTGPTRAL